MQAPVMCHRPIDIQEVQHEITRKNLDLKGGGTTWQCLSEVPHYNRADDTA